jgi:alkaline phosphatase
VPHLFADSSYFPIEYYSVLPDKSWSLIVCIYLIASPLLAGPRNDKYEFSTKRKVRNIIFMVSDGMSHGTLNMADLLLQRKEGRSSNWIKLYRKKKSNPRINGHRFG